MANGDGIQEVINLIVNFQDNASESVKGLATSLQTLEDALKRTENIRVPQNLLTVFETIGRSALSAAGHVYTLSNQSLTSESIVQTSNTIVESLNKITNAALNAQRALQQVGQSAGANVDYKNLLAQLQRQQQLQGQVAASTTTATAAAAEYGRTVTASTTRASLRFRDLNEAFLENRALLRESARQIREFAASGSSDLTQLARVQQFVNSNQRAFQRELTNVQKELTRLSQRAKDVTVGSDDEAIIQRQIAATERYANQLQNLTRLQTGVATTTANVRTSFEDQTSALDAARKSFTSAEQSVTNLTRSFEQLRKQGGTGLPAEDVRQSTKLLGDLQNTLKQVETQYNALQAVRGGGSSPLTRQIDDQIGALDRQRQSLRNVILQAEALNETFTRNREIADNTKRSTAALGELETRVKGVKEQFDQVLARGTNAFGRVTTAVDAARVAIERTAQEPFITPQATQQLNRLRGTLGTISSEITRLDARNNQLSDGQKVYQRLTQSAQSYQTAVSNLTKQITEMGQAFSGGRVGGGVRSNLTFAELSELQVQLQALRDSFKRITTGINNDIARVPADAGPEFNKVANQLKLLGTEAAVAGGRVSASLRGVSERLKEIGPLGDILTQLGLPAALSELTGRGITFTRILDGYFNSVQRRYKQTIGLTGELSQALGNFEETLIRFRSGIVTWAIGLQLLGVAASLPFVLAIRNVATFEDRMRQVQAVTNATEQQFHKLEEAALLMGRTTRFTALEASEGLVALGRAGFTADEAIKALPTTLNLAQAAALELGKAADIVTNIMTSFELSVEELPKATDVLAKAATSSNATIESLGFGFTYIGSLARGLGADFEDLVGSLAKLNNAGFKGTLAGTALRGALDSLFNPTADEARLMEELSDRIGEVGLSIRDVEGNFVGFVSLIRQLESAGFTADEALRLFGQRAGPGVAALLRIGSSELDRYVQSLENAEGTTAEIAAIMEKSLFAQFKQLISAVEGLGHSIGANLSPILGTLAQAFSGLINRVIELRNEFPVLATAFDVMAVSIAGLVAAIGTLSFAWALMIVPAVQAVELLRTFLVPAGLVARTGRNAARRVAELGNAMDTARRQGTKLNLEMTKQLSSFEKFTNLGIIDLSIAAAAGGLTAKEFAEGFKKGTIAESSNIKTGIFANLGTIARDLISAAFLPLSVGFSEYIKSVRNAQGATNIFKAALTGLLLVGRGVAAFFLGGPLRIALTAIVGLLFYFGRNADLSAIQLQKLAGQSQSTARDMDLLIGRIAGTQRELSNLSQTQIKSGAGQQIQNLNEDVAALGAAFENAAALGVDLGNIEFIPQVDKFNNATGVVIRFGENLERVAVVGAASLDEFNNSITNVTENIENLNEVRRLLAESFRQDARTRSVGIGIELAAGLKETTIEIEILKNQLKSLDRLGTEGFTKRNKLASELLQLLGRLEQEQLDFFRTLGFQNLEYEDQLELLDEILNKLTGTSAEHRRTEQELAAINAKYTGINEDLIRINAESEIFVALAEKLRTTLLAASNEIDLSNALLRGAQSISGLQNQLGELEEELQKVLDENRDLLDQVLEIDEGVLDANLNKVRNSVDAELAEQERALDERKSQITLSARDQADANAQIRIETIKAEQEKLAIQRRSFRDQEALLKTFLNEAKRLVGSENTIEIERNLLGRRKTLLEEELEINRSVFKTISDERAKLAADTRQTLDQERDAFEQLRKFREDLQRSQSYVTDSSRFFAEQLDVSRKISETQRLLTSGSAQDLEKASQEFQRIQTELNEARSAIPSSASEAEQDAARSTLIYLAGRAQRLGEDLSRKRQEFAAGIDAELAGQTREVEQEIGNLQSRLNSLESVSISLSNREVVAEGLREVADGAINSANLLEALQRRYELLQKVISSGGLISDSEQEFLGVDFNSIIGLFDRFKNSVDELNKGEISLDTFKELFGDVRELEQLRNLILDLADVDIFDGLTQGQEQFFNQLEAAQSELERNGILGENTVKFTLADLQTVLANIGQIKPAIDRVSGDLSAKLGLPVALQNTRKLSEAMRNLQGVSEQIEEIAGVQDQLRSTEQLRNNYLNISQLLNTITVLSEQFISSQEQLESQDFNVSKEALKEIQNSLRNGSEELRKFEDIVGRLSLDDSIAVSPEDFERLSRIIEQIETASGRINFNDPKRSAQELAIIFDKLESDLTSLADPTRAAFTQLENNVKDSLGNAETTLNGLEERLKELKNFDLGEANLVVDQALVRLAQIRNEFVRIEDLVKEQAALDVNEQTAEQKLSDLETQIKDLQNLISTDGLGELGIDTKEAREKLNDLLNEYRRIKGIIESSSISVGATGGIVASGAQTGGLIKGIQHFSTGGPSFRRPNYNVVPGFGSGDKVPALLEPGEFIIRKSSVNKFGVGLFHALNQGMLEMKALGGYIHRVPNLLSSVTVSRPIQRFANGGSVSSIANQADKIKNLGVLTLATPDGRTGPTLYGDSNEIKSFVRKLTRQNII